MAAYPKALNVDIQYVTHLHRVTDELRCGFDETVQSPSPCHEYKLLTSPRTRCCCTAFTLL